MSYKKKYFITFQIKISIYFSRHNRNKSMEFILNLNLSITDDLNIGLNVESSSILAFITYCELNINIDFKCVCYYTQKDLEKLNQNISLIEDSLNKGNYFFKFKVDCNDNKREQGYILIKNLDQHLNELECVKDTTLPSLIHCISKISYMNITGLASLYRFIAKIAYNLRSFPKIQTILVTNYFFPRYF